jgi:hypothetical protein
MEKIRAMSKSIIAVLALSLLHTQAQAGRNAGDLLAQQMPDATVASLSAFAPTPINWEQPPLGCIEEMVPNIPSVPCLDLSLVEIPMKDWPVNITPEEKQFWYSHRRNLQYCRSKEVLRREAEKPGSQGSAEVAWMIVESVKNSDKKINAVYDANKKYGVPLHILTGALFQESLFAELGISEEGGNFSCGLPQLNMYEWCVWANAQSTDVKKQMNWPANISCGDSTYLNLELIRPLFEIAKTRLKGTPEYRLMPKHFENIPLADVVGKWPVGAPDVQARRLQTINSFLQNCTEPYRGIMAKASVLKAMYNAHISQAFKDKDRYAGTERFKRSCRAGNVDNAYPLHMGWLFTVAAYNAGPRVIEAYAHYNRLSLSDMNNPNLIKSTTPDQIIPSLYWAGRYNPVSDKIDFNGYDGSPRSWIWFKGCVVQRHVARVMQHVTLLPEFFVDTLEAPYGCAKSTFDSSGRLVKTGVPLPRQSSSGQID